MVVRNATAKWEGSVQKGRGMMRLGSGACEAPFSFSTRFEDTAGTNPEELIGAAHAGCFSMALAHLLGQEGHAPTRISTSAAVHLDKQGDGFAITRIELETEGEVPGIDESEFQQFAEQAKKGCPVSKALAGVEISLKASLAR